MGPTLSINKAESQSESNVNLSSRVLTRSKKGTIFLFDWDDTLMCTSFISLKSLPLSEEEEKIVCNLGKKVSCFLQKCSEYGKIIIMTNSSKEWMKETGINFLKLDGSIFRNITIISTRDIFSNKKIDKKRWKEIAFQKLLLKLGDEVENIICASDSDRDIELFKKKSKNQKGINIATIKFKAKPSPLVMIKEIDYLNKNIYRIIGANKHYFLVKEKENTDSFNFSFGYLLDYIFTN